LSGSKTTYDSYHAQSSGNNQGTRRAKLQITVPAFVLSRWSTGKCAGYWTVGGIWTAQ